MAVQEIPELGEGGRFSPSRVASLQKPSPCFQPRRTPVLMDGGLDFRAFIWESAKTQVLTRNFLLHQATASCHTFWACFLLLCLADTPSSSTQIMILKPGIPNWGFFPFCL